MTHPIARVSAAVLLLSLWLPAGAAAQLTKLNAAYSAESSWSLATWVAQEGGYFKKYGLDHGGRNRAISGGSMSPPALSAAKKAGLKEMADFESLNYKYPATVIATTRSFIQRQRAMVLNFLRGEIEGIHAIRTRKEFAVNALRKYMRISDADILEDGYRYALKFIQPRPFPTLDEVRAVLDEFRNMPQAVNAKPEQFIE